MLKGISLSRTPQLLAKYISMSRLIRKHHLLFSTEWRLIANAKNKKVVLKHRSDSQVQNLIFLKTKSRLVFDDNYIEK